MYAAIAVGVIIIGMSIFFVYSSDQAKERGKAFGKAVEFVQDDLRKLTHSFDSKVSMFKQGDISKGEFLEFTEKHEHEIGKIILRYNNLQIPQSFVSSVELFKLSAETQLESDHYMIENSLFSDCYFYLGHINRDNFKKIQNLHRKPDLIHILKTGFDLESDITKIESEANKLQQVTNSLLTFSHE